MVSRQLSGAKEQDVLGVRINDYKMDDKVLGVGGFGKVRSPRAAQLATRLP